MPGCHSDVLFDFPPKTNGWNLKITPLKKKIIFQTFILGFKMLVFGAVILPPWHFYHLGTFRGSLLHSKGWRQSLLYLRGASCRRAIGTADERTHLSSFCQEKPGWDGEDQDGCNFSFPKWWFPLGVFPVFPSRGSGLMFTGLGWRLTLGSVCLIVMSIHSWAAWMTIFVPRSLNDEVKWSPQGEGGEHQPESGLDEIRLIYIFFV